MKVELKRKEAKARAERLSEAVWRFLRAYHEKDTWKMLDAQMALRQPIWDMMPLRTIK